MKNKIPITLLLDVTLLFLFAVVLRLPGLTWGLPSDALPHVPYHPDEGWTFANLHYFNPLHGQFITDAYREGNLAYYIWFLFSYLLYTL